MVSKEIFNRIVIATGLLVFLLAGLNWVHFLSKQNLLLYNTSANWLIILVALEGVIFSYLREDKNPIEKKGKILRHPIGSFIDHWTHATGFVVLAVSGILLGFRSYLLSNFPINYLFIPRLVQTNEITTFLFNLHFLGILFFVFAISYHISYHLKKKSNKILPKKGDPSKAIKETLHLLGLSEIPKEDKYEAVERLEYLAWSLIVIILIISGLIKVSSHIWFSGPTPPTWTNIMLYWSNLMHDTFALIGIALLIVHIITAAIIPSSWPFIKSMATGWMPKKEVKQKHEKWYEKIEE
ncbi:MAG: Formate dehydrogenase cytochrome b556 subunit [Candidatus Methanohalarchaeum thermophilum]|uniref:Formate dehydrogenase cytochrome b556 subunit n=1 Tax=Methanohalarchaeum thermophilum TaxID=1903181 RepID=A0A1Q6DWU6_METT1|nr:MAG: Formate dehydrogenase cytochrome b556 subunit [Candidatus Methanohalarchaeum thermophilum]